MLNGEKDFHRHKEYSSTRILVQEVNLPVSKTYLVYLACPTPIEVYLALPRISNIKSPRANICGVLPIGSAAAVVGANGTWRVDLRDLTASL